MSGPDGSPTKRDQRREARRAQFQQRQLERTRERARRIRNQRLLRAAIIGGSVLLIALLAFLIVHAATGNGGTSTPTQNNAARGTYTTPANGTTRDGMQCLSQEGGAEHIHAYLAIYANGKQVPVPAGIGIVDNTCLYALHVHEGMPNIIHVESDTVTTYTLGQFFDIWGQPLSKTRVQGYKADASHKLTFVTFDANGHMTTYTGDPWTMPIQAHESIIILYNSPDVQPAPHTDWTNL